MKNHFKLLALSLLLGLFVLNSPKALAWGIEPIPSAFSDPPVATQLMTPIISAPVVAAPEPTKPPSISDCDALRKLFAYAQKENDQLMIIFVSHWMVYYGCL